MALDIKISNLNKAYGPTKIFENFNAEFKNGQIYAIMGESGIGKTTLLRLIVGLEKADSGLIETDNKTRFSYVFQENRLCDHLTAAENVVFTNPGLKKQYVECELLKIGFSRDDLDKPVSSFSGGMKRRVALLRALMHNCDVVLMDEPLTGLDEATQKTIIDYILEKKGDRTLIVVTHSAFFAHAINATIISL